MPTAGRLTALVATLCTAMALTACGLPAPAPSGVGAAGPAGASGTSRTAAMPAASSGQIATADNALGFSLLTRLAQAAPTGNVFLSAPSLALDLGMLFNGARGATATAMARTMDLGALDAAQVNAGNAALLHSLQGSGSGVTLDVADALWANRDLRLVPAFLRTAQADYGASVSQANFASPSTAGQINAWVDARTHGKIPSIVGEIPANTALMLLNAVYFKGAWAAPFNPARTRTATFTTAGGAALPVPLMSHTGIYPYAQGKGFQAISLPYAGGRFSMEIVLPTAGLAGIRAALPSTWSGWQSALKPQDGTIELPRFTLTYSQQLASALSALGMGPAFSSHADFSGLCGRATGCQVSSVIQKTYLHVDEQGTTATAATSIGVTTAVAIAQHPRFVMDVNHPFLCAIIDDATGLVLFAGYVNAPQAG